MREAVDAMKAAAYKEGYECGLKQSLGREYRRGYEKGYRDGRIHGEETHTVKTCGNCAYYTNAVTTYPCKACKDCDMWVRREDCIKVGDEVSDDYCVVAVCTRDHVNNDYTKMHLLWGDGSTSTDEKKNWMKTGKIHISVQLQPFSFKGDE